MNADGTGYLAQRAMACRDEREARIAVLVFTLAQILLRSLLWLPIGLGLLVLFPPDGTLAGAALQVDREGTFVRGIGELLPSGVRGLMIAGMLAALASTLDTHLNWGASYWTHDLYERFVCRWLRRVPSARELVWVARASTLGVLAIALLLMTRLDSIQTAWHASLLLGAGMGVVLVLRWLWWRLTAAGELATIVASSLLAPLLLTLLPDREALRLLLMGISATLDRRRRLAVARSRVDGPPGGILSSRATAGILESCGARCRCRRRRRRRATRSRTARHRDRRALDLLRAHRGGIVDRGQSRAGVGREPRSLAGGGARRWPAARARLVPIGAATEARAMKRARGRNSGARSRDPALDADPLWYKDAVFYEIRIGAFQDGDGDGTGDFRGLSSRLDYLRDLGVTVLWLLPFCQSPMRDDGYDISDYTDVHPDVGTLDDFKEFLDGAHRRGLRVVTELIINHTSDQHPWFQRARRAPPGSALRDWYVWSDSPHRYADARIIFKDFERSNWTWDPVANAYYWHRFYSHQPDLNFDNPVVRRELLGVLDFWLGLGVDGLRLDATPYLFEREETSCENLPETHQFLKELRAHVDARWCNRMLLAEANQWPEDAVAYFGNGDECHMAFHFPLMPRLFMSLHMEDRHPIVDISNQTPAIPDSCQWALFLRNHDELTLEMVTDEERDYMYRVYAHDARARINLGIRRRLAPLLGNDRRRIELLNALLFSLPGTPSIYYGDEIGMGDNFYLGDRNGVRTPMQWSSDKNAGFSAVNPQRLFLPVIVDPEYHYESVNVEAQQQNPYSLLNWMKRLIALRKRTHAFGHGSIEFLHPSNRKVLAFVRQHGDDRILVVANLSRFVEYVELDLAAYKGMIAVELFGRNPFPPIGELPYLLTLGPHSFYWMSIEAPQARGVTLDSASEQAPVVHTVIESLAALCEVRNAALEAALPRVLASRRWSGVKSSPPRAVNVRDVIPLASPDAETALLLLGAERDGSGEAWVLPVGLARGEEAEAWLRDRPHAVLVQLESPGEKPALLFEALESPGFCTALLEGVAKQRRWKGGAGEIAAQSTRRFGAARGAEQPPPSLMRGEQSNSTVIFGDRFALKLFRRPAAGVNPDLEIGRFLTERTDFSHTPRLLGHLEYRVAKRPPVTLAVVHEWVPNEGDAWRWTLDRLRAFYEDALALHSGVALPEGESSMFELAFGPPPPGFVSELLGGHIERIRLLGQRTAELHVALASDTEDPGFAPERFTPHYQRSLYQSMRNLAGRTLEALRTAIATLPADVAGDAARLLASADRLGACFRTLLGTRIDAMRIRTHGDYHLGQVLYTGSDFTIIDFEGEPARSLEERRIKRSPLRDVAGMLRSFDYAARGSLRSFTRTGVIRSEDAPRLVPWSILWRDWMGSAFLRSYLRAVEPAGLVPQEREPLERLLRVLLLEKATYELRYELDHRPEWTSIPLGGLLDLIGRP